MATAGFIVGILSLFGTMLGCIPLLGALNWVNIPFGFLGIILSGIAMASSNKQTKGKATAGLVMSIIAVIFGAIRLMMGGGIV
ncbi:MAG TPA: hypothetical protein PLH80_00115 [Spirochaetota bacterium]|nr:hypothetical protein [Spirochaetota bacterium]HOM86560.1 hypothetical protein [Spirochaetota bacterium]HOR92837.1 hypothetical protein [Spirochaetota bacterium]HOT18582.1 hypothetical protein [Spirochaetota bacterium]HPD03827.1 hypothetical protein [Spirochaetota bacterium]